MAHPHPDDGRRACAIVSITGGSYLTGAELAGTLIRKGICIAAILLAFAAVLCVAADRADAASQAWTTPGAVTLEGDDNPHHFVVWNSLSLSNREFELQSGGMPGFDTRTAEVQAAALDGMAEAHVDESLTQDASKQDELTKILAGITLTPTQQQAVDNLRQEVDASMDLYTRMHDVAKRLRDIAGDAPSLNDLSDEAKATYRAIEEEMTPLIQEAREGIVNFSARASELVDEIKDDLSAEVKQHLENILERENDLHHDIKFWASRGVDVPPPTRGAAGLGLLWGLAVSAATAYSMQYVVGMTSSRGVVIEDLTGNPIEPVPPLFGFSPTCRSVVRRSGTTPLGSAVWCPEPYFPNLFQIPDFPDLAIASQLIIEGGDKNDVVDLRFDWPPDPADQTSFRTTFVRTGEGNDTIYGSPIDDHLAGGPGFDTIVGGSGNDRIYGENAFFNVGVDASKANDRLCGGAGSDFIDGQLGDDLVFGGADDDTRTLLDLATGAALKGGPGSDALIGGSGVDDMDGGYGRDSVFSEEKPVGTAVTGPNSRFINCAREAGFGNASTNDPGVDVIDRLVDCGYETGPIDQYSEVGSALDSDGYPEYAFNCDREPQTVTSLQALATAYPDSSGAWPWF